MKRILFLLFLIPLFLFGQEPFKPGPYLKGTVVTSNGLLWKADVDMKLAQAAPSENRYWSLAGISDAPAPIPTGLIADGVTDNFPILQGMIDKMTIGEIKVPTGDYYFSNTISWFNKSIWLIGSNGTRFIFKNGVTGIVVNRDRYFPPSRIENITVETFGAKQGSSNGVEIHSITNLENVTVKNFAGKGFSFTADIQAGKTDVSHSMIMNCTAKENGGDGFFFQGGDANAITVIHCSASDNGGIGFYDNSFLGNSFIGCMAHANAGGHYRTDDGNARSTYIGNYQEEDSPPSYFGGVSRVTGGLMGWEIYKGGDGKYYYRDNNEPYRGTGGYIVSGFAKVDAH
jgi:hypothetical protein